LFFVGFALASLSALLKVGRRLPNNGVSGQTLPQDSLDKLLFVFLRVVLGFQTLVLATLPEQVLSAGAKFLTVILSVGINERFKVLAGLLLELLHDSR